MFDERARFRLHHPVGPIPPLVIAAPGVPDVVLAQRCCAAFQASAAREDAGAVWEPLLQTSQGAFIDKLAAGEAVGVADELASLGRSEAAQGFFAGAGQHRKCNADPSFAQLLAAWTKDKLLSLAEALGVVPLELPEAGRWNETTKLSTADLWQRIQEALAVDLSPPTHVGAYPGIEAGDCVLQMRVVEAIYAAWRLRQLAEEVGGNRVCEIGAGAGFTAYYARLLGISHYTLIDLPSMNAVQGYLLGGSRVGEDVSLAHETGDGGRLRILPPEAFARLQPGSIDILYNQDSLPEIERAAATGYLRSAADLRIPTFLSINQEASLVAGDGHQSSVNSLTQDVHLIRRVSRHRHWLRQGYVEEVYRLKN